MSFPSLINGASLSLSLPVPASLNLPSPGRGNTALKRVGKGVGTEGRGERERAKEGGRKGGRKEKGPGSSTTRPCYASLSLPMSVSVPREAPGLKFRTENRAVSCEAGGRERVTGDRESIKVWRFVRKREEKEREERARRGSKRSERGPNAEG